MTSVSSNGGTIYYNSTNNNYYNSTTNNNYNRKKLLIIVEPISQTVTVGEDIYLTVKATSSSSISYSWYKDSISIKDSNNSTLSLYDAKSVYDGTYYSKVTSNNTSVNSSNAVVSVLYPNSPNATVTPDSSNPVNPNTEYYQYTKLYNQLYNQHIEKLHDDIKKKIYYDYLEIDILFLK